MTGLAIIFWGYIICRGLRGTRDYARHLRRHAAKARPVDRWYWQALGLTLLGAACWLLLVPGT